MPMPMQCNLCDGYFKESNIIGVCNDCLKDVKDNTMNCSHPHTYLGCCTICGKDREYE